MADLKKIKVRVTKERAIFGANGVPYPIGHELTVTSVPYGWRNCVQVVTEAKVSDGEPVTADAPKAAAAKSPFPVKPSAAKTE